VRRPVVGEGAVFGGEFGHLVLAAQVTLRAASAGSPGG
jgi:hypothetical protein